MAETLADRLAQEWTVRVRHRHNQALTTKERARAELRTTGLLQREGLPVDLHIGESHNVYEVKKINVGDAEWAAEVAEKLRAQGLDALPCSPEERCRPVMFPLT